MTTHGEAEQSGTVLLDRFVEGIPATFATRGERPWKEAVAAQLADVEPDSRAAYVELDFTLEPATGYPGGGDLDNLCEPVFSVIANQLRWFGGSRPNIRAFRARKRMGEPRGCQIRVMTERWPGTCVNGSLLLRGGAPVDLPRAATDLPFADWVAATMVGTASPAAAVGVELLFPGPVNLGDIATGRIKNVIDCLRPAVPNDANITVLEAARLVPRIDASVQVRVVELADRESADGQSVRAGSA